MSAGKILTANRLSDGLVVFLGVDNVWTRDINRAVLAREPNAEAALEKRGQAYEENHQVTGAYLVAATREDGVVTPVHIRERIRAQGPTVRPDLSIIAVEEFVNVSL
ncbi:MAG: DUF2849 domain-containing protein [Hyphomicrobiales bacterium]